MADTNNRPNPMTVGVPDARPYGVGGNTPADAVVTAHRPNGSQGRLYVSDAPYLGDSYNERPQCDGVRTNGLPCKAKVEPSGQFCRAHLDQNQHSL